MFKTGILAILVGAWAMAARPSLVSGPHYLMWSESQSATSLDEASLEQEADIPPSVKLEQPDLRYRVVDYFGNIHVCGPIVASIHDRERNLRMFATIKKDSDTFRLIARHLGFETGAPLSDDQKLSVYREYGRLQAVRLGTLGRDYRFQVRVVDSAHPVQGTGLFEVEGRVNQRGQISILGRKPLWTDPCPKCLSRGTRIDTPDGPQRVEDLHVGMLVWTLDGQGKRVVQPILKTAVVPVFGEHVMVHLRFADGREIWLSPVHPTADGQAIGDLKRHSIYYGGRIQDLESVPYRGDATYDLLPAGDTGFYWANGILLGSTLR